MKLYKILKNGETIQSPIPGQYAGHGSRKIFGRLNCGTGRRLMKPENRVFFHMLEDAVREGYRPCGNCRPINEEELGRLNLGILKLVRTCDSYIAISEKR